MRFILLIGNYPPPYGGIASHLACLHERLLSRGIKVRILNIEPNDRVSTEQVIQSRTRLELILNIIRRLKECRFVHLHTNGHNIKSWSIIVFCAIVSTLLGTRAFITIHSGNASTYIAHMKELQRIVCRKALRNYTSIIVVNDNIRRALVNIRIPEPLINIIPAYVSMTGVGVPLARKDVSDFLSEHRPLLASVVAFRPEYGIHVLLGALKEAIYLYPSIGLVIIGYGSGRGYISQQIADMKLQNHICIISDIDNKHVIALLSQVDILLRATFYDGDSISVREALSRGTPVVASNTGFRPEGVIKFQVGNQADLLSKLVFVLNNIEDIRLQLPAENVRDYFDQLLDIYKVY